MQIPEGWRDTGWYYLPANNELMEMPITLFFISRSMVDSGAMFVRPNPYWAEIRRPLIFTPAPKFNPKSSDFKSLDSPEP